MKKLLLLGALMASLGSSFAQSGTNTLTNGLVAWYPLHGNANDYSGNGNNGSCSNGVTFTTGYNGLLSASFNGNSQYIRVEKALLTNNIYSYSCWFYSLDENRAPLLNAGWEPGHWSYGYALEFNEPEIGKLSAYTWGEWQGYNLICSNSFTKTWHHAVVVSDGTTNSTNSSIYVDGILLSTGYLHENEYDGFNNLYIGGAPQSENAPWFFNGLICNVRIYNRALSSNEVSSLYAMESTPPPQITTQPTDVSLTATNSQTATFSVVATNGVPPYAYQWMKDGVDLTNQTNASVVLSNAGANTVGYYSCDVTDQSGTTVTSSNAALNITGVDFNLWQGLVAYYPFKGNANDASVNGNNATAVGTYSYITNGGIQIFGDGQTYYSGGGYIQIPTKEINGDFTISFMVGKISKSREDSQESILQWNDTQNNNVIEISGDQDNRPQYYTVNPLSFGHWDNNYQYHITTNVADGFYQKIHFITLVKNGDLISGYLDGSCIGSTNDNLQLPNRDILWLGHHEWWGGAASSARLNACYYSLRIYNRALSSNEVSALFQAEAPAPTNNQTITFATIPTKAFGAVPFSLTATSSAGMNYPITYSSSDPTIATVSSNKVTITGVGSCLITASQPGDFIYKAATNVSRTLTVTQGSQTIPFSAPASRSYSTSTFTLPLNSSAGLSVSYSSSSSSVATISGNVVTIAGPGSTVITATQAGNANYKAAPTVNQTLVVSQAAQTITFPAIASKAYGAPSFNLGATATSGLPITYSSSNTNVATVSGNTVTIRGVGSTTITASQAGNANYVAAPSVGQSLTVTKAAQTITFTAPTAQTYGNSSFTLSATASSGLPVTFTSANTNVATISGNTVTIKGAGTVSITASQSGNANYNAATSVAKTLTVAKASQTVSFSPTTPLTFVKNGTFTLSASSTSGGTITFTSGNTGILSISGKTATMKAIGSVNVTATAAATTNYNAATKTNSITLQ
jgi:hypothetical protein